MVDMIYRYGSEIYGTVKKKKRKNIIVGKLVQTTIGDRPVDSREDH